MDVKTVVEAGGHGLDTVIDNVAKLRSALPEEARQIADSAVGTDVAAMLAAAGERAEVAKSRAAELAEAVKAKATELTEASAEAPQDHRSRLPVIVGAVALTGAAAAGAVIVWRRRQAAAVRDLSGDTGWETSTEVEHTPSVADDQSPEAMDPHFAEEVDEVADEIAEDFVHAVEGDVAEAQQPSEPFVPGVADEQSPDAVDEAFAAQVDAVADEIAEDFVQSIEESEKNA